MEGLRTDNGFIEVAAPSAITSQIFTGDAFEEFVRSLKEDPSKSLSPDAMGKVTIDHIREFIKRGILDGIVDQNVLVPIRPKDYGHPLRNYVNSNWPQLSELELSSSLLRKCEKVGVRKELSIPSCQEEKYPVTYLLSLMTMSFYRRVQQAMIEELTARNFVVGADEIIKKDIMRTNYPKGHVVKLSSNPTRRETPLIVPRHPNFIETSIFPLRKATGEQQLMVLNEDIGGAKRLDKFTDEELSLEDKLVAILTTMPGCAHLHKNGLVYHDVKPSNIFQIPNANMEEHWILGDSDTVIEEGAEYTNCVYYATPAYLDAEYYDYGIETHLKADRKIDVFAYGMSILEQYIGDEEKFHEFCNIVQKHKSFNIDMDLIEWAMVQVGTIHRIPYKILEVIADMLQYDRKLRPEITRVYELLSKNI